MLRDRRATTVDVDSVRELNKEIAADNGLAPRSLNDNASKSAVGVLFSSFWPDAGDPYTATLCIYPPDGGLN